MMTRIAALLLLAALGVFMWFCVIVIDERHQAYRTLLQDPEYALFGLKLNEPLLREPGLYVSIPFLHQVYMYDKRKLPFEAESAELYTAAKIQLEVDYYAIWQIVDPRLFFERNRTNRVALQRLDEQTYEAMKGTIADGSLEDLLSDRRADLTRQITRRADQALRAIGIQLHDLRFRKIDYPEANIAGIYERMKSERQRSSRRYRAEGEEEAQRIRAKADRDSVILRSDARRQATETRGEGDAQAAAIYAAAYGQDSEFYAFVRSLEVYRTSLDDKTTLVLSPKSPFLRYLFADDGPAPGLRPPVGAALDAPVDGPTGAPAGP